MLLGLTHGDPLSLVGIAALLMAVAALAGYFPARRASRITPCLPFEPVEKGHERK